jgi:hypothetical protein
MPGHGHPTPPYRAAARLPWVDRTAGAGLSGTGGPRWRDLR